MLLILLEYHIDIVYPVLILSRLYWPGHCATETAARQSARILLLHLSSVLATIETWHQSSVCDFHSAPFDQRVLTVLFRGQTLAELLPDLWDGIPLLEVVLECVTPTCPSCIQTSDHFIDASKVARDCLGQIS